MLRGALFAAESSCGQLFCCCGKGNDGNNVKSAHTYRASTRRDKIIFLRWRPFFDAKGRRHLVVPLIYFWYGAIHIDVPLSGSGCGRQAIPVLHFLFSQKENAQWCMSHYLASHWDRDTLGVKDFYIDRGNCQGQSSTSAQSVIFWRVSRHTAIWQGGDGGDGGCLVLR